MKPTILYKLGGPHRGPMGTTYSFKGVSDERAQSELLQNGWFHTLDEAISPPKQEEPDALPEEETEVYEVPEPKQEPKKGKLSDEEKEEIVGLLKSGDSAASISKKYGVSTQTIYSIKKKNGAN